MKKLLTLVMIIVIVSCALAQAQAQEFISERINWPYTGYDANIRFVVVDAHGWTYVGTQGKLYNIAPGSTEPAMFILPPSNNGTWYSAIRVGDSAVMSRLIEFIGAEQGSIVKRWYQNPPPFTGVFNWCIAPDGTLWGAAMRAEADLAGNLIKKFGILKGTDEFMLGGRFPEGNSSLLLTKVGPTAVAATNKLLYIGTKGEINDQGQGVKAIYGYNLQTDSLYIAFQGVTGKVNDLEIMTVGTDTVLVSGASGGGVGFYKVGTDGYLEEIGVISATAYDLEQLPDNKLVVGYREGVMVLDVNQALLVSCHACNVV